VPEVVEADVESSGEHFGGGAGAYQSPHLPARAYAKSCSSLTPSACTPTMKASAVVAIGVDLHSVGRDDGAHRRLPVRQVRFRQDLE
jgi:hypothetical protein